MKKCPLCNVRMKHGFCPECGLSEMMAEDALPYCEHLPKEKHRHWAEVPRTATPSAAQPARAVRTSSLEQSPATPYGEEMKPSRKKAQVSLIIAVAVLLLNLLPLFFSNHSNGTPESPLPEGPTMMLSLPTDTLLSSPAEPGATVQLTLPMTVVDCEEFKLVLREIVPSDLGTIDLQYELENRTDAPLSLSGETFLANGLALHSSFHAECEAGETAFPTDFILQDLLFYAGIEELRTLELNLYLKMGEGEGELEALAPILLGDDTHVTLPEGELLYNEAGMTFSYLGCEAGENASSLNLPRFWFAMTNNSDHPISVFVESMTLHDTSYEYPGFFYDLQPGYSAVGSVNIPYEVFQNIKLLSLSDLGTVTMQFELVDTEKYETMERIALELVTDY